MFDADAFLETLKPPQIKLGGVTYTGRLLSIEEWLPFESRLSAFKEVRENGNRIKDLEEMKKVLKQFCDLAFPSPLWRIMNPFRKTISERIVALPPAALFKATRDFFECQRRALDTLRQVSEEEVPSEEET